MSILSSPTSSGTSRRTRVKLSVESASGKRRRLSVEIDRSPTDTDATIIRKASEAYRMAKGFADRIVAVYVTQTC